MEAEASEGVEHANNTKVGSDNALMIAVSVGAVFRADEGGVYEAGVAFPLLQAVQKVNERLLQTQPSASEHFQVILISTNTTQQQHQEQLQSSATAHALQIHQFCFSSEEDFVDTLLQNEVHLFLTTDSNEATQATDKGVLSVVLDPLSVSGPSEQLRVLFCADAVLNPSESLQATQVLGSRLGQIRQRFGVEDSPLSLVLLTCHGGVTRCGAALRSLRAGGVDVDEAYCLGGTPRGLILPLLRPHLLLDASRE